MQIISRLRDVTLANLAMQVASLGCSSVKPVLAVALVVLLAVATARGGEPSDEVISATGMASPRVLRIRSFHCQHFRGQRVGLR